MKLRVPSLRSFRALHWRGGDPPTPTGPPRCSVGCPPSGRQQSTTSLRILRGMNNSLRWHDGDACQRCADGGLNGVNLASFGTKGPVNKCKLVFSAK